MAILVAAGSLLLGASVAQAIDEVPAESSISENQRIVDNPEQFIEHVNQINLLDIQEGQLAQQKGQSKEVKDFGNQLVHDHQALSEKLRQLASQSGIVCTTRLNAERQKKADDLSALSGSEFDKKFLEEQQAAHKRSVSLFEYAADKSKDVQIKTFAQENVASLRHHLHMAQSPTIEEPTGADVKKSEKADHSKMDSH